MEKWLFLDQNHGLTPWEKCQFCDFLDFLFLQPRKTFFVLEDRVRHFRGLYWLKTKVQKKGHYLTKTMCSPLWKNCNFSTSWTSCFYSLERRFIVLEYRKSYFLWPILPKNKSWKNGWFGTKTMSIFRLFEVVLIA